ncbi:MAG: type I restriction-modification system subunit M N-terminal domain-containing protein, partial [archaeon]
MQNKKWTQKEVNEALWQACDTFRGKIDSSIYKNYILVMLFMKYISDVYKEHYAALLKKYDGDEEMANRQIRYDRFTLNGKSSFDYLYQNRNASSVGEII